MLRDLAEGCRNLYRTSLPARLSEKVLSDLAPTAAEALACATARSTPGLASVAVVRVTRVQALARCRILLAGLDPLCAAEIDTEAAIWAIGTERGIARLCALTRSFILHASW